MFDLGMDFSTLDEVENLGGKFYYNGKSGDLIDILAECGVNAARLRLWVDPYSEKGEPYGAGTCDIDCVTRLAKRVKAKGMRVLLDLHYSDFWCDPARQLMPKSWMGLDIEALCERVYQYTKETMDHLNSQDAAPYMVQVGNEITNGMLWPVGKLYGEMGSVRRGYDALFLLVNAGCKAVRGASDAKIMLHLENSGDNALWREWFDEMIKRGADFDVIGASYYPYWHGGFDGLKDNLNDMIARHDKDVIIAETAYAFTAEHYDLSNKGINLVINDKSKDINGVQVPYPLTPQGQSGFIKELLNLVKGLDGGRGKGVYYWEPAWIPIKGTTWATRAAREYMDELHKPGGNEWANQCLFDYSGSANAVLNEFKAFALNED